MFSIVTLIVVNVIFTSSKLLRYAVTLFAARMGPGAYPSFVTPSTLSLGQQSLLENPWPVPTAKPHTLPNQLGVAVRRRWGLPFVAELVAVPAGGDDIHSCRRAPVLAGHKVLTGALEVPGLLWRDAVLSGELKRAISPHWQAAVKAAAGLMGEGVGAGTHQRSGHEKLLKNG